MIKKITKKTTTTKSPTKKKQSFVVIKGSRFTIDKNSWKVLKPLEDIEFDNGEAINVLIAVFQSKDEAVQYCGEKYSIEDLDSKNQSIVIKSK